MRISRHLSFGLLGLLALVGLFGPVSGGSAATAASSGWSKALQVPGSGVLNVDGNAAVASVSCPTSGNCVAGGHYTDGSRLSQAFVVEEKNGVWGHATAVPGLAALGSGGASTVNSVSCSSPGNCAVGGHYDGGAFVVDESNGAWGDAIEVPGIPALYSADAHVDSVSCATAGNCAAGGAAYLGNGDPAAFVVDETGGTWGRAVFFANPIGWTDAGPTLVSCPAPGNCTAGSTYVESLAFGATLHVLVADEKAGSWGTPVALGTSYYIGLNTLSCPAPGNCAAGGYYDNGGGQAFVADETNGVWGAPLAVPGSVKLNAGDGAQVTSVSCWAAGNCAAGGVYIDRALHGQAFVASETNGKWGRALKVPGAAALNKGHPYTGNLETGGARITAISCGAPRDCNAGGYYHDRSGNEQAFVVSEKNGVWGNAMKVPGLATLDSGHSSQVTSISCPTARDCVAGGQYSHHSHGYYSFQAFVVARR